MVDGRDAGCALEERDCSWKRRDDLKVLLHWVSNCDAEEIKRVLRKRRNREFPAIEVQYLDPQQCR